MAARQDAIHPTLRVTQRQVDEDLAARAREAGLSNVAARVLAARGLPRDIDIEAFLSGSLGVIAPPLQLKDMDVASRRLALAIMGSETIAIQTDYDVDGLGAHAVMRTVLTEGMGHPPERVQSVVGNRLTEGYGMTESVAERILALEPRPSVLITADTGSSDEPRIALLKAAGIDVLVTDHHLLPLEGPPGSALACVNPQRPDCPYPDKAIAGGMVAWLLMAQTRRELIDCGYLEATHDARLADVLDFVACSTVADCVSLGSSLANRAVVRSGLRLMNRRGRPCWQVLADVFGESGANAETIAFQVGPRINSRTRLDEPMAALHFLLADSSAIAATWRAKLEASNEARKLIERSITERAELRAADHVASGATAVTLLLEDAHPGVQGICASRIVERFGRPALLCTPNTEDASTITGSARGVEGFHCRDALEAVQARHPGLLLKAGGHAAAAGVQLRRQDFPVFQEALEAIARTMLGERRLGPYLLTDGPLDPDEISFQTIAALTALEPFGRGFEPPVFTGTFRIRNVRRIGDGSHLKLVVENGAVFDAVWFRALKPEDQTLPIEPGKLVSLAFELKENLFRGSRRLQLMVKTRLI